MNEGSLPLHQSLDKPLANIADVVALGNTGPHSTLGYVLQLFATGNHAKQVGSAPGVLNAEVASTQFSLDFPGTCTFRRLTLPALLFVRLSVTSFAQLFTRLPIVGWVVCGLCGLCGLC